MLLIISSSCVKQQKSTDASEAVSTTSNRSMVSQIVDSIVKTQPNALNNDLTRQALADSIKTTFTKYEGKSLPFLRDLPVKFAYVEPYHTERVFETFDHPIDKNVGRYLVQFTYSEIYGTHGVAFSILTTLSQEDAMMLKEGEEYIITGNFLFFPDNSQERSFYLPNHNLANNTTTVSTKNGLPLYMIGNFIMDNVSFKAK